LRINFRSLRESGITWEALAGTPIDRIQSRAGHEHIATTLGYVKAVEDLKGKFGAPFGTAFWYAKDWAKCPAVRRKPYG
jgi:hypothetical protein